MIATRPCEKSLLCSHSIGRQLSRKLALFTMATLGVLCLATYFSVEMLIVERNAEDLQARCELIATLLKVEARTGGEAAVVARLRSDALMRGHTRLEVWRADGTMLHADAMPAALLGSAHQQTHSFAIPIPNVPGGELRARYTMDFTADAEMGQRWAWTLTLVTLLAGGLVAVGSFWHVRRELRPLNVLASQTRAISSDRLDQRLSLSDPAEELLPWITQFNALMDRLERAYRQLEGFNADVAHELRTPLAALIGETEVALSRPRSAEALQDTLASNLEELQRLAALVNDMLFLSQADRGAEARRGEPVSMAELARDVMEFHEAPFEDAGLQVRIEGDAVVAVDVPLVKRALSNLLGNAARYAERGSTVVVRIAPEGGAHAGTANAQAGSPTEPIQVVVQNAGQPIDPGALPRLFDRFFRADEARCKADGCAHYGLGLAIVAAIARMHAGTTLAESQGGLTRVGFTLATGPVGH
jgi:two-component system heavy metal sensor histidine kinase CusS